MTGLNWGILGTGGIARAFTSDLIGNGFSVTAVGSRAQDTADAFASEYGIARAHGSYSSLADDPDVDVIYVSTPHTSHAEWAELALQGGKHVLVEKPFTINAGEAQRVVDLAIARDLVVLEAMWTRFLPGMAHLREVIAAGTIGEVKALIADHTQDLPKDPEHRLQNPELGGGALLDLGIYPVSFSYDLFGRPESILVASAPTPTGVDARDSIVFTYDGGRQASLHTALDTAGPNTAVVLGTGGRIDIDATWYAPTSYTVYSGGEVVERYEHPDTNGRGMHYQAAELERIVASDRLEGDLLPPEQSVAIMRTLDDIRAQIGLRYPGE
jgi:predicted dehydrogenase